MGAYMAPSTPASYSLPYVPAQQMENRYIMSPQGAGEIPHDNRYEQPRYSSRHNGPVVNSALVDTHAEGPYYGWNIEPEARMVEILAVFNDNFIRADDRLPSTNEEVVEPQDDLVHDGTIDPGKLSLPLVVEKVPCPECGRLLKDERSVRFVASSYNSKTA